MRRVSKNEVFKGNRIDSIERIDTLWFNSSLFWL